MRSILFFGACGLLILATTGCRRREAAPAEDGFVKATDWPRVNPLLPVSAFQVGATQNQSDIALKLTNSSGFDFTDYSVHVTYARVEAGIEDLTSQTAAGKSWKRAEAVEISLKGRGSPISKKIRLTVRAADQEHPRGGIPGKGAGYRDSKIGKSFTDSFYEYQHHITLP